jgi:hypothetical protein
MKLDVRRIGRAAAVVLAGGALAVPAAGAASQDLRSPDARDAASAAEAPQDLRSPDSRDAAAGLGTFSSPQIEVVRLSGPEVDSGGCFDWGDAGIGAGTILGLILLGGTLLAVHRRHAADGSLGTAVPR